MATYRRKVSEVTARQYVGPASTTVMHNIKGEMHAKKGDWLVGDEPGFVEVVKNADFDRDYEAIDNGDVPQEVNIGTSELVIHHPDARVVPVVGPQRGTSDGPGIIHTYSDVESNKKAFANDKVQSKVDTDGTMAPGEIPASTTYDEPHAGHDTNYDPNKVQE